MGHRRVKEDGEALLAPPDARIEPAYKTEVFWLRSKVLVAILLYDFLDMIVAHLALAIAGEDRRIGNVGLLGPPMKFTTLRSVEPLRLRSQRRYLPQKNCFLPLSFIPAPSQDQLR